MMLKGRFKIPDKARVVSSDRPGSSGKDRGSRELSVSDPHGFGSGRGIDFDPFEVQACPDGYGSNSKNSIEEDEKRSHLEHELSQEEVNLEKLQRIASNGIPHGGSLRATTWKVLLGYLPPSTGLWEKVLSESRLDYAKLKEELLQSPTVATFTWRGTFKCNRAWCWTTYAK